MIGYVTIGTNDLDAAIPFFDALLAEFDATRAYTLPTMAAWSFGAKRPLLMVTQPYDKAAASHGNGAMVALMAHDAEHVDRVHALALSLGAVDEGAPGPRGKAFHAGYFRDLDGNKFNAFVHG
jgi:catechol 2,3-dioxygenase-like lactoylglutathione lyase family enzyme